MTGGIGARGQIHRCTSGLNGNGQSTFTMYLPSNPSQGANAW
jgi:hypothetical protein